jgi:acyl carrier protein
VSQDIEARIATVVRTLFLGGNAAFPLDRDMSLIENGICDSMGLVQLATAIEKEFPGLRIPDQEITHDTMGSVLAIAELVRKRGVVE